MRRKIPPLSSMITFESVGRNGSLKLAADELLVSHSAVSQQIRNLETALNTPVFLEKGKRLTLTPQGKRLLSVLSGSLDDIQKQIGTMSKVAPPRHLKIASSAALASSSIPMYAAEFVFKQEIADFSWVPVEDIDETVDLIISGQELHLAGKSDVEQVFLNYFPVCRQE